MNKAKKIKELLRIKKTQGVNYIRVGSDNDGGYVMANDFKSTDHVISCGIGDGAHWGVHNLPFEEQISPLVNSMDMYDYVLDSIEHNFKNTKYYKQELGSKFGISNMLEKAGVHEDYILKMDIEGAELDVFAESYKEDISNFRQIVMELHWFDRIQNEDDYYFKILRVLSKINESHNLVVLNPNNYSNVFYLEGEVIPEVFEVLYLRKDSYNFVDVDAPEDLSIKCDPHNRQLLHSLK